MATPLQPHEVRTIGIYGVIRPSEVNDTLIPDGAVPETMNFHFDRKGAATLRTGLSALGSTVLTARPCVGLHNVLSKTAIAVFSNGGSSTIYSFGTSSAANAWAVSLDGGTASVKIRFIDFGTYTIAINFMYNTYSSMRFWDGGTRLWQFTGRPINPQNMWGYAPQLGEVYKSRIYLAGDTTSGGTTTAATNTSRLFFSSVVSSTGNITWSPTIDFVDINPGDGENITALKRFSLELLVFKPNYIYRFRTSGVDPDPLIKIGTRSHESVIEGKRGLYFHHDTGFYRYSGGYPLEISRPISDFVDAIPYSQYAEISAWNDSDHIYWSIGNVTIAEIKENVVWRNVVVRYTESSDVWTIYSYSTDIRRGITYNTGTALSRVVGTDYGLVATHNSGNTDMGEPIKYRIRTKWYEWEGIASRKVLEEIIVLSEKALAAEFQCKVDEENNPWQTIGQLKKFLNSFRNLKVAWHRIKFQVTGVSTSEAMIFNGFELIKGLNEGIIEE